MQPRPPGDSYLDRAHFTARVRMLEDARRSYVGGVWDGPLREREAVAMPKVVDNSDGTKTFSVNSGELRVLRNLLHERIPGFKRVLQIVEGPDVKATLDFVRSVVD
jgi:hypothetical protein